MTTESKFQQPSGCNESPGTEISSWMTAVFIGGAVLLNWKRPASFMPRGPAGVPPDDVIHIVMPGEFNPVGNRVVGRVSAQEKLILADLPNPCQGTLQKGDERFLRVLGAGQQRTLDQLSFVVN